MMNGKYYLIIIASPLFMLVNYVIFYTMQNKPELMPIEFLYVHLLIFNFMGGMMLLIGFILYPKSNPDESKTECDLIGCHQKEWARGKCEEHAKLIVKLGWCNLFD